MTPRARIGSLAIAAAVGSALSLASAHDAHANGRAPLTNGVFFRPGDAQSIYLRTTFGLLISHDDGCTFDWICETDIGYSGPFDPKYSIATDASIFASTYEGLRVSRDGGCSFTSTGPAIWVDALDIAPTGEIWIATADGTQPNDIYASTDNGATFQSRGMLSPTIWWKSVKAAPSNPQRVYVTGYQVAGTASDGGAMTPTPHFFITSDDGGHWTESPLTGFVSGQTPTPIVAAIDPSNPDLVYVVSLVANPPNGDLLFRSTDGGQTFTQVLATTDAIRNVVLTDATHVIAVTQTSGSFVSSDHGVTFAPIANPPQLECLGQRSDGQLIGCGANWQPDYAAVTRSLDGGATWQPVWRFVNLHGPLACPDGTPEHDTCALSQWPSLQAQFGSTGPTCGANVIDGAIDAPGTTAPRKKSGCCQTGEPPGDALLAAAIVAFVLTRRRAGGGARRRARASSARSRSADPR